MQERENQRGQSIFLSIVGVATLLVAIVGATFAYFSLTVQGNEDAEGVNVTTAVVGDIIFTDGAEIVGDKIYPGWSAEKTFTIANTTVGATDEIEFEIILNVIENTLSSVADGQFVHELVAASSVTTAPGTVATLSSSAVPALIGNSTIATGTLNGTDTHTYVYKIQFIESGEDQNDAQGKAFNGKIQVQLEGNVGMRTWDSEAGTWKPYVATP